MRKAVAGALVAAALAFSGCGGGDAEAKPAPAEKPLTLAQACPQVEEVLPGSDALAAPATDWNLFRAKVADLVKRSDLEARNALEPVVDAAETRVDAGDGQGAFDAETTMLEAISRLADRCRAAGSSALQ